MESLPTARELERLRGRAKVDACGMTEISLDQIEEIQRTCDEIAARQEALEEAEAPPKQQRTSCRDVVAMTVRMSREQRDQINREAIQETIKRGKVVSANTLAKERLFHECFREQGGAE